MHRFFLVALVAVLAFTAPQARAAENQPVAVTVQCSCEDAAGKAYADAVRSTIGRHAGYRLQSKNEVADDSTIVIRVVSTRYESHHGTAHAMLSVVATREGVAMHEVIDATCDPRSVKESVKESAKNTVEGLKDLI